MDDIERNQNSVWNGGVYVQIPDKNSRLGYVRTWAKVLQRVDEKYILVQYKNGKYLTYAPAEFPLNQHPAYRSGYYSQDTATNVLAFIREMAQGCYANRNNEVTHHVTDYIQSINRHIEILAVYAKAGIKPRNLKTGKKG